MNDRPTGGGLPERDCTDPGLRPAERRAAVDVEFSRLPIRRVLDDASDDLRRETRAELLDIIRHQRFSVVYQAIADVRTGVVLGHEALCRGPGGTAFEAADFLFASGHELDLAHELDKACRDAILRSPLGLVGADESLGRGSKLFLNVLPDTLAAGLVSVREILDGLAGSGLGPGDVVLELSERIPLEHDDADELRRRVEPFRAAGFLTAMDDIGAGYWTLRLVPALEPDFLKVDRSLIHGIHTSPTQQDIVAAIIEMGDTHGAEIICEGIEVEDELETIIRLGARFGQGFLLALPTPSPIQAVRLRRRQV